MKEDYLWDRTGSDAEMERLELLMGGLAFRAAEAPVVPVREFILEPQRGGWFLRLGMGSATAAAAAVLLIAILSMRQESQPVVVVDERETAAPIVIAASPIESEPAPNFQKVSVALQRKPKPKKRVRREAKVGPALPPRPLPVITLTAEEADAYRQLMTALSITGTNLNIVRDKINGTEE